MNEKLRDQMSSCPVSFETVRETASNRFGVKARQCVGARPAIKTRVMATSTA